jgi:hypothetical protein
MIPTTPPSGKGNTIESEKISGSHGLKKEQRRKNQASIGDF